jgi:hypothetical protein
MQGFPHKGTGNNKRAKKSMADEIFAYLHKVRTEDENYLQSSDERSENQFPGSHSTAGFLFNKDKPVARYIPDRPNITFTSTMPKSASIKSNIKNTSESLLSSIGKIKLSDVDDAVKGLTGSPLVRAGALGLLGASALYAAYPWLDKPDPVYSEMYGGDRAYDARRKRLTTLTGVGLTSLGLCSSIHPNIKDSWYRSLPKKHGESTPFSNIRKGASMLGPADFVPLGFAQKAVMESPTMSLDNKFRAVQMLNAIPGGPETPITSTDIVSAAVNTGASAGGYPLGRATVGAVADSLLTYAGAKAFGADNPGSLAAKVGLGSLGIRLIGSMF